MDDDEPATDSNNHYQNSVQLLPFYTKQSAYQVLFGFALLLIPFMPASHMFFYAGFIIAERVLYSPSMGFCILIAILCRSVYEFKLTSPQDNVHTSIDRANKQSSHGKINFSGLHLFIVSCLLLYLYFLGARTWLRNNDWSSPVALLEADTKTNPYSGRMQVAFCGHLHSLKKYDEAIPHCEAGVQYSSHDPIAYSNFCGVLQQFPKRHAEAEKNCLKAIQIDPSNGQAYSHTCGLYLTLGRYAEGETMCNKGLAINEALPGVHEQLCALISAQENPDVDSPSKNKRMNLAYKHCKRASEISPDAIAVYSNWCGMLIVAKRYAEAEKMCENAVQRSPSDNNALSNLVVLFWQSGRKEEALKLVADASRRNPTVATFASNLCMMRANMEQWKQGVDDCMKALQLDGNQNNAANFCKCWGNANPGKQNPYDFCTRR
jgi:tetratricopeptide (TPR) repeat protein